jgi:hypothetical protein
MGDGDRAGVHEDRIPACVIQVVVGVDHESNGQRGQSANRREEPSRRDRSEIAVGIPLIVASMTATESSPMTNPVFAPAAVVDVGLEIAAQTFGPTGFSVNEGSAVFCAHVTPDMPSRPAPSASARDRQRVIVGSFRLVAVV